MHSGIRAEVERLSEFAARELFLWASECHARLDDGRKKTHELEGLDLAGGT